MAPSSGPYDVIIVGGGVIGCASARELAPDHDVLVVDAGTAGGETTPKASGLIAVVSDIPEQPAAARHAVDFFEAYDGTGNFTFTRRPGLHLVTEEEAAWGRDHASTMADRGFDVTFLTAEEIEDRHPGALVLEEFVGGVAFAESGWVDPYTYTMTLKADAEDAGADYQTDTEVESIVVEDNAVTGVRVDGETIRADNVVCATGWRTRELLVDHVEIPVRPFRWQAVNLTVDREFDETFPMAWDRGSRMYWRPEHNGDLHVGGGTYFVDEPGDIRSGVTPSFRAAVAETIGDRVRNITGARFKGEDCCPTGDAATPDDRPIVDAPLEAPDGLVVALAGPVGGIMCSPFISTAVRSLVTGEGAPFPLDPFGLDRFDDLSATFDCEYVTGWQAPAPAE